MEAGGQRYSVLVKSEVREQMVKEIDQISEVFSVSKSDATVILTRLRWNSFKASDRLGDNKEKFLAELGLVRVVDSNSSSADREKATLSDGTNGDYFVSTPFCSHKFSKTCWSEYLTDALEKNKEEGGLIISCLNQDCVAPVGPDTIGKLSEPVKDMYEGYLMKSFVEGHKATIKWCPESGCQYAIVLQEDTEVDFGVVCLCGHTFCWTCGLESHRPVTCKKASIWCKYLLDHSRSVAWINSNTNPCPNCSSPVQQNGDPAYRLIECICEHKFCWVCLRTEEEHNGMWNCAPVADPVANSSPSELTQILHLQLWEADQKALEEAKSKRKDLEENIIPKIVEICGLSEQDLKTVREAGMLIVQCIQVLKWSRVFDYFINEYESTKKQYLKHLRDQASAMLRMHGWNLGKVLEESLVRRNVYCSKHMLETSTTTTGNHFDGFVKELEDGMPQVKTEAYEDGPGPSIHWLCRRCTFENSYVDKHCKMCAFPLVSPAPPPPPEDLGKME
ncbi:hypothetical protein CARUB_v10003823mg [Capsella rubella]|uniref:RBR-type E3 ubiquitin transferase n=1 Tax=Capsella rubella TaxID=81985 RepID=R0HGZ8_9BRAS|nr:probable E3 ubiquitin-protein ligase ARI16 [Capsella rubella]EOA23053.1 hypothetical protein CARUB_v10003823mg [Capsella rubella]